MSTTDIPMQLPVAEAQALLEEIAAWGNVTTIIIHGGSVFEFKGPFPRGENAQGYYNLKGAGEGAAAGFEGHLKLAALGRIELQEKQHRGRDSYSVVFSNDNDELVFKIFLGRENDGSIIAAQLTAFKALQQRAQ